MNVVKMGVRFIFGVMVVILGGCTGCEFLCWVVWQLVIICVCCVKVWWVGFVVHIFYCGVIVVSILVVLMGNLLGLGGLVVMLFFGMGKGVIRVYVGWMMFFNYNGWFDQYGWVYFWMMFIVIWVWFYGFV